MKNNGVSKHIIMFCTPFLLYAIAVVLIFLFLFTMFTEKNALWRAFTNNEVNVQVSNDGVDHDMEIVQPSPVITDEEEKVYYDINTFPSIKWGKKWATLTVEYLGAKDVPVYEGDTDTILNYGIAHYYFSKFPGQGSNCVLSFHVNRQKHLYYLEDIPLGEQVVLNTSYGKYVYKVVSKDIFETTDKSYIQRDEGEMLTIYTCYPKQGPYRKQRIAITCAFVEELSDPTWR
jgi:sortase A